MTIKIKNYENKELFSFEAERIEETTIAELMGVNCGRVRASITINASPCWGVHCKLYWHIKCEDNKWIMFSFTSDKPDLYEVDLCDKYGLVRPGPESWEEVMEWGR